MPDLLVEKDSEQPELQALIEEARRHQRQRRLVLLGVAVLLMAGAVAYLASGQGGLAHGTSSSPYGPPAPSITRAGLARITFSDRDSTMGGCIPDTNSPITTGVGSIDFVGHSLAVTTLTRGCNGTFPSPQKGAVRWIKGVLYTIEPAPHGSVHWSTVPRTQLRTYLGANPLPSLLTSPWALSVVNLAGSSAHRSGSAVIAGQPVIGYAGVTTLLAVEAQLESVLHTGSVAPAPSDHSPVVPTAG